MEISGGNICLISELIETEFVVNGKQCNYLVLGAAYSVLRFVFFFFFVLFELSKSQE